jgi:hypothetical protein
MFGRGKNPASHAHKNGPRRDLTGQRFGFVVVEQLSHRAEGTSRWYWVCRCDCGTVRPMAGNQLVRRGSQGCGCQRKNNGAPVAHGHGRRGARSLTLKSYYQMVRRCTSGEAAYAENYACRGIRICENWLGASGFAAFLSHVGERPSSRHSLDRIDNDKGYEPGNVRWATPAQQARNQRRTKIDAVAQMQVRWLIAEGGLRQIRVAEAFGVTRDTIRNALLSEDVNQ